MVKVSVVIPIYNVENYLGACLDSIVNQTLKDIEIICINDGSKDNSLEVLKSYAKKDDRFTVIDQEKWRECCCYKPGNGSCNRKISLSNGF